MGVGIDYYARLHFLTKKCPAVAGQKYLLDSSVEFIGLI